MRRIARPLGPVPLIVVLLGVAGLAMLVPSALALAEGAAALAGLFAKSALIVGAGAAVLGAATMGYRPANPVQSAILSLVGAYLLLPPVMALPLAEAMPEMGFADAWFEMVSAFTTTGASLLAPMPETPAAVHLWVGLVGWLGGFFVLLAATALLAPLNLGGLEVANPRPVGRSAFGATPIHRGAEPSQRLWSQLKLMAPIYAALTLALWVLLLLAGDPPFPAAMHAMGILSTSGLSPVGGIEAMPSGRLGEAMMLAFLVFALSRRTMPGAVQLDRGRGMLRSELRDEELRLALALIVGLALVITARNWIAAAGAGEGTALGEAARSLWAALFTLASFLTTTGYVAGDWEGKLAWAGLSAPALLLAGVATVGGGVATTAGGIKLLRVFALYRHGRHEMERLLDPALVGGGGERARHLRSDGAYLAWMAFMLFVLSLAAVIALLTAAGLRFEPAVVLAIAALSTTGPLVAIAGDMAPEFAVLGAGQRAILGAAMILGRLELLAVVALLAPEAWRR